MEVAFKRYKWSRDNLIRPENPVLGWASPVQALCYFQISCRMMTKYDYLRYQGFQVGYSHSSSLPGSKQLNIAWHGHGACCSTGTTLCSTSDQLRRASFIRGLNTNSSNFMLPSKMVTFHSDVCLPEGNHHEPMINPSWTITNHH